jgi:two-component system uhpT operon response regulator UhpA
MREYLNRPLIKSVSAQARLKVLLVGRQDVLQRAIHELIGPQPDMEVTMVTQNLLDASRWLKRDTVQVVILDWPVLEHGAEQIIRDVTSQRPGLHWLAVSLYDENFMVKQAFDKGIKGYVTKAMAADKMCEAIRALQQGHYYCSPDVLESLPAPLSKRIGSKKYLSNE